jgi:hypothetical protein
LRKSAGELIVPRVELKKELRKALGTIVTGAVQSAVNTVIRRTATTTDLIENI